jgi:integrase
LTTTPLHLENVIQEAVLPFTQLELSRLLNVVHIEQTKVMIESLAWSGMRPEEMKVLA